MGQVIEYSVEGSSVAEVLGEGLRLAGARVRVDYGIRGDVWWDFDAGCWRVNMGRCGPSLEKCLILDGVLPVDGVFEGFEEWRDWAVRRLEGCDRGNLQDELVEIFKRMGDWGGVGERDK
uniref:Uncharacterized protein n=1 Tax=viral metagenome TaxID=1070528 RepID=A0A6M3L1M0_9ZZZZ